MERRIAARANKRSVAKVLSGTNKNARTRRANTQKKITTTLTLTEGNKKAPLFRARLCIIQESSASKGLVQWFYR
jgi:hypothetical protein